MIPSNLFDAYCRDLDGCKLTIGMQNNEPVNKPGLRTTREARFYKSATSNWWILSTSTDIDIIGFDGDTVDTGWGVFDCVFTDAQTGVNTVNGRSDGTPGFGFLNSKGGWDDSSVACILIIED